MGKARPAEGRVDRETLVVGLISDTHGLLRNEVYAAFEGVDEIFHAGDVGDAGILGELQVIAPVRAVYGNVDGPEVRGSVEDSLQLERAGHRIIVLHGHQYGSPKVESLVEDFPSAGVIVYGHTHEPLVQEVGDILVVNPGSAGHRRFGKPVSVGRLTLEQARKPRARLIDLA